MDFTVRAVQIFHRLSIQHVWEIPLVFHGWKTGLHYNKINYGSIYNDINYL